MAPMGYCGNSHCTCYDVAKVSNFEQTCVLQLGNFYCTVAVPVTHGQVPLQCALQVKVMPSSWKNVTRMVIEVTRLRERWYRPTAAHEGECNELCCRLVIPAASFRILPQDRTKKHKWNQEIRFPLIHLCMFL